MQPTRIVVLVLPIKTHVLGGLLDIGTPYFSDVSKSIGQKMINFSLMEMV